MTGPPETLYQRGIMAVTSGDGPMMMRAGWTLWHMSGMENFQAFNFLTDGYDSWKGKDAAPYSERLRFLQDLFGTLEEQPSPPVPPDIYNAPPESVQAAAAYFCALAWAGSQLWTEADAANDAETMGGYEARIYRALASSHRDFLPPRSIEIAGLLAARLGVDNPFG
jgi:hypothetical protein